MSTKSCPDSILTPYRFLQAKIVADRDRVEEFETPKPRFALVDLGIDGILQLVDSRMTIDLLAENLFDRAFRDHLSRYKAYVLNMGRNFALKMSVPFAYVR